MGGANVAENPPKALMFIIHSMKYYVQTAMLTTTGMTKLPITALMIRVAKIVEKLVLGRNLTINGGSPIQMERSMFASI